MSWDLLRRLIDSDYFNNDPFLPVAYLSRYADHIGIHHVLCSKLRQFTHEEIEFFLPQLCHLIISVDNESMALEDFIIELCQESVNGALLTFWLFQTYLHELADNPHSNEFKTCRRVYNQVQNIIFGGDDVRREKIHDNVYPMAVLASFVLASVAAPFLPGFAGPLAIAQARKPRPLGDTQFEAKSPQGLRRSQTVSTTPSTRPARPRHAGTPTRPPAPTSAFDLHDLHDLGDRPRPARSASRPSSKPARLSSLQLSSNDFTRLNSSSMPDIRTPSGMRKPSDPRVPNPTLRPADLPLRGPSPRPKTPPAPRELTRTQRVRVLKSNYFRSETLFLSALEDISNRLVVVPKPARLSALRAELALVSQDLPAEVDIPVICPATLPDGSAAKSKHHRIVRLNPAEATVLNSAERVPFLLMVEVLREDFDFDPDSESNKELLVKLGSEEAAGRRRIFDLTVKARDKESNPEIEIEIDSVFEPTTGDLGSSPLIEDLDGVGVSPQRLSSAFAGQGNALASPNLLSNRSQLSSPLPSGSNSPRINAYDRSTLSGRNRKSTIAGGRASAFDQPDIPALATHMRTAAQMLAQLDSSGAKRPKDEVEGIKAKIIASMQNLEEQNFYADGSGSAPTFDMFLANESIEDPLGLGENEAPETRPTSGAGAARMENDQKTGGLARKGDRDDPSAATFGEEWKAKKERIRKSSPYGLLKNWDLLSVIVKTGSDLRQEAFACQLIAVCSNIWRDTAIPVWVKRMRILVAGESSGLIETITNGVSLHSLKRSLTFATIAAGTNPRRRIATLKDHFVKAFGEPETETYKAAADSFMRSLAAYSIISYVLQLKDRHNGNILIDNQGHIIHIDFGFMLSNSPGSVGFEAAPFKLTQDYVDVLGGVGSPEFEGYKALCKQAFQALRKSADKIIMLVDMMGKQSKMPCFSSGVAQTVMSLRQRFQLHMSQEEAELFVETDLIGKALGSYYTRLYDTFQYRTQGIY
ncbi:phosphatidylinositol 3 [Xylona heveae TC161]|uniref:1-phosphatidylinositol 4-kinase n=1 Tax=Xylona heveae (strain CBS 132557 / TC161) TaxID=1328760 RepID=A0A165G284_XYLHT|nr:phosphatidylinositol 3 [Xylona heveae TC161]KZF21654.1 phosphatidylinositol 3 [Xylona heveae TC161]